MATTFPGQPENSSIRDVHPLSNKRVNLMVRQLKPFRHSSKIICAINFYKTNMPHILTKWSNLKVHNDI